MDEPITGCGAPEGAQRRALTMQPKTTVLPRLTILAILSMVHFA